MCLLLADPFHPWTAASIGFSHSTCPPPAPQLGPLWDPPTVACLLLTTHANPARLARKASKASGQAQYVYVRTVP